MAKMGRKPIVIDWDAFDKLCGIQCSLREISAWLNCSEDTVERAVLREKKMTFAEYFDQKRGSGRIALRRKQFETAMGGNTTMLIWLGKQYLGQVDKQEVTGKDGGPQSQVILFMPENGSEAKE